MKISNNKMMTVAALLLVLAAPVIAQAPAAAVPDVAATASVHGHVTSAAGLPLTSGEVAFTKDKTLKTEDQKVLNTFSVDANGDYKGTGVAPGSYFVYVNQGVNHLDRQEVTILAGDNKTIDFDMSRADYLAKMTPEERKALDEYKKTAGETIATNKVVANLNATLGSVRADLHSPTPNFDQDVADMKAATDSKPEEGLLWMTYGDVLLASGDHMAADDKAAGKPAATDDDLMKRYADAADAYKKGADLNAASKKPIPADQGIAWGSAGSALAKMGKIEDAQAAFDKAAALNPAKAGMFYNNEAAIFYNGSQTNAAMGEPATAAADKAIAADPTRPDPYYIKGQILLQKSTLNAKTQKLEPPPGCVDAYQHYLSLAPDGKYAPSVKDVLAALGEKVDTHYSAGKHK